MRAAGVAALVALGSGWLIVACSSTLDASPAPDSGADVATPPILPVDASDAGVDEGGPDAQWFPDARAARALDVVCEGTPCYRAVSAEGNHVCGLLDDKTVRCWGRDFEWNPANGGVLGRGAPVSMLEGATPKPVVGLSDVEQIRVGPNFGTCARTTDGSVYCWGKNNVGQLGQPPSEAIVMVPTRIEGLPPVDEMQLGASRGCAIGSSDRALYCWGTYKEVYTPPQVMPGFDPPVNALAIGSWGSQDTILAVLAGDTLAATGDNLPEGDTYYPTNPVTKRGVIRVAQHAFAISDGRFVRWRPEDGTFYVPSLSPIVDLKQWFTIAYPVESNGGAVTSDGRLFRWGNNSKGTLGQAPSTLPKAANPVEIERVRGKVASFAMTVESACVVLVNGKLECWGANSFGELGRGSIDPDPHPEAETIR